MFDFYNRKGSKDEESLGLMLTQRNLSNRTNMKVYHIFKKSIFKNKCLKKFVVLYQGCLLFRPIWLANVNHLLVPASQMFGFAAFLFPMRW